MAVTIICPNLRCRCILQVPENVRGKKVRCGKCGKNLLVPAPERHNLPKPIVAPSPSEPAE